MILSQQEIAEHGKTSGARLVPGSFTPVAKAKADLGVEEKLLAELVKTQQQLTMILEKISHLPKPLPVAPPEVNVAAPNVVVNTSMPNVKEWVFKHSYNQRGDLIETTAQAIT